MKKINVNTSLDHSLKLNLFWNLDFGARIFSFFNQRSGYLLPIFLCFLTLNSWGSMLAQHKKAYQIFDSKGKAVDYGDVLKKSQKAQMVFFGELHNNPICHWLQLELTQDLYAEIGEDLVLGAEMFEADNQILLDEYLQGAISEKNFEKECRLWDNYATDYKPLVVFAQKKELPFIATNIPRRYASIVFKGGEEALQELSETAQQWIAPLPLKFDATLPGYKAMLDMMRGHKEDGSANMNFPKAQAIKDATMAHFILENWKRGQTFLHYNGTYHSNNKEGIIWYIQEEKPKAKIITISTVEQADLNDLAEDNKGVADFIIVVNENMGKSY